MMPSDTYIDVAVALPVYNTFTYGVPDSFASFVAIGKRVLVPFGKRRVTGYILGYSHTDPDKDLKLILDVLDDNPLFVPSMVPFFQWISDYYKHPLGEVIKTALPGGLTIYDVATIAIAERGYQALRQDSVTPIERQILQCLKSGPCRQKDLSKKINQSIPAAIIQSLERRGRITKLRELGGGKTRVRNQRYVTWVETGLPIDALSPARQKILEILKDHREISVKELKANVPSSPALIRSLEDAGYLKIIQKRVYRDPFGESIRPDTVPRLTQEQQHVVNRVCEHLHEGFSTFLLQGVTGSGKTEVYMQVAADAIRNGQSVLVLVPEIALIAQMEHRFRARFGERIAVLHSGLSAGERFDQWDRILNKAVDITIGARSAIFAPFENVGVIIVDEEHDTSYKQETRLRYNARDLAVVRAMLNNCVALLGSATPSVQSYYNACLNKFIEVTLKKRIEKRPLPEIDVVDLRDSRDARGVRRFITSELYDAMRQTLARGEQTLLFLNRRGFASLPICASCGQTIRCKHCDISLTLHQKANAYKCHYCGFSRASSSRCSLCGSSHIKHLGLGTEKVESALNELFPEARVARMDRDTTTRKGSILTLLKGIKNKTIDILVGTQMVAKGHDFPNITLVGIICADLSLSFPDFRAGERTFQILAQVAGRAGRGDVPGRVILQTFNPDHFSIQAAKNQDFKAFYAQEIKFRQALNYPPLSRMIQLKISGKDPAKTETHVRSLGKACHDLRSQNPALYRTVEILGPIEASLPRIAQFYRWQILLKSAHTKALHNFTGRLLADHAPSFGRRDVMVVIDVDPYFMM